MEDMSNLCISQYHRNNKKIQYHVAYKTNEDGHIDVAQIKGASKIKDGRFRYCNADRFLIQVSEVLGSAKVIYYDLEALKNVVITLKKKN